MLSHYKNASLEFGAIAKSSVATGRLTLQDDADITHGAYRLARELDQFISKGLNAALAEHKNSHQPPKSGESVADLQLHTARKVRQVRNFVVEIVGEPDVPRSLINKRQTYGAFPRVAPSDQQRPALSFARTKLDSTTSWMVEPARSTGSSS
jgi:hypothetical protein